MEKNGLYVKLNIQRFANHLQTWGTYYRISGGGNPATNYGFDASGQIAVYLESQNIANNTSYIRIDHRIKISRHNSASDYDSAFVECTSSYRANQGSQGGNYQSKTGSSGYNGNGTTSERIVNLGSTYHTVTHNANGTGKLYVNGTAKIYIHTIYRNNPTTFATVTRASSFNVALPTIPRYTSITTYTRSNITLTSFRVNWASANTVDRVEYRINSGAWTLGQSGDRTSGNFTVSGRSPGTTYQVQIRVRRKDSGLWTNSSNVNVKTTDIAKITSAPDNVNPENPITVNFSNPGMGGLSLAIYTENYEYLIDYRSVSGTTITFSLTEQERNAIYNLIPTKDEIKLNFRLRTIYDGTSYFNYALRKFIVTNANPAFSNFEYADVNTETVNLTGDNQVIIKGYSNLRARVTSANKMIANKGAIAKEYQLVVGAKQIKENYSSSANVDMILNAIDNNVFIVYAIDSRGNSTPIQKSPATYIDYFKPTIGELTVSRENNISTYTNLNFSGTFFNDNFGAENNTLTATYEYLNTKTEEWKAGDTPLNLTITDNNFSFDGLIAGDLDALGFDISESFEIRVKVEDMLTDESRVEILVSAKPNLAMHKEGTAIGGMYDETLDKGVQLYGDNLYYNGIPLFEWEEI